MLSDGADMIPGASGCNTGNGGSISVPSARRICAATNDGSSCGRGNPTPGTSGTFASVDDKTGNSTPLIEKIFRNKPLIPEV
jgi:hypothetical protein